VYTLFCRVSTVSRCTHRVCEFFLGVENLGIVFYSIIMFYSKYRPQKFSDLVGLETLSKSIITALTVDNLAHAYFFYGPRGTGKTTVARLIAKALNCSNLSAGDVCGECSSCKAIEEGRFLDLIEIDAASNRGIDDIRALRDKVNLAPTHKKAKVYIIDEAHMLTTEAFNALLKTLEEPPKRVYFVLCTTNPQKVPDTIKSRCLKFEFKRVPESSIVKKLVYILENEGVSEKISNDDLKRLAQAAVGGFRDAETLLEQVLIGGSAVDEVVSGGGNLSVDDFVDSLEKNASAALSIVHKISLSGVDLTVWGFEFLKYARTLLLVTAEIPDGDLDVSLDKLEIMKGQAGRFSLLELAFLVEIFSQAIGKIKDSVVPSLPLEVAIVKWFEKKRGADSGELRPKMGNGKQGLVAAGVEESKLKWEDVLKTVKPYNHSVEALLRSCRMVSLEGDVLNIEVSYSFHKERLDAPKNRQIVEEALKNLLGRAIKLKCRLGKKVEYGGDLTDKNISEPKKEEVTEMAKSVLEVFDGGVEV